MRKQNKDLPEIISEVKANNQDSFEELYRMMHQRVYFFALSVVRDEHLAQDVVQETFINVYRSLHTLKDETKFISWLNRITYNCALRLIEQNSNLILSEEILEILPEPGDRDGLLTGIIQKETSSRMIDYIMSLPIDYRSVLILKYYDCLKIEEIAESLGCTAGSIKSRLSRAKKALKKVIMKDSKSKAFLSYSGIAIAVAITGYAKKYGLSSGKPMAAAALHTASIAGAIAAASLILIPLITGIKAPSIDIGSYSGSYTNQPVNIPFQVTSPLPLKDITITSDSIANVLLETSGDGQTYTAIVTENGTYRINVKDITGQNSQQLFSVDWIDTEPPEFSWYSWNLQTNRFLVLVSDNLSGIDYTSAYKRKADGSTEPAIYYDESTGKLEFSLSEESFYLEVYDNAGNPATYQVSAYTEPES